MAVNQSNQNNPQQNQVLNLPRHIAIVMDGNGRWAQKQHLPRFAGHKAGVDAVRRAVQACADQGIEVLTLFAFSSENWQRPAQEVDFLMSLFTSALNNEVKRLHANNVQLRIIGDVSRFNNELRECIAKAEQLTAANTGLKLIIAAAYGGRWDILQATQQLAQQVAMGKLKAEEITDTVFSSFLCGHDLPEPALFIRTGGEFRISNFLLWQLAYTELFFTDRLWPEFDEALFSEALAFYASRQRRFGCISEQIESVPSA